MENVILIVLLTAAVAVGIWYTIRHFKGEAAAAEGEATGRGRKNCPM